MAQSFVALDKVNYPVDFVETCHKELQERINWICTLCWLYNRTASKACCTVIAALWCLNRILRVGGVPSLLVRCPKTLEMLWSTSEKEEEEREVLLWGPRAVTTPRIRTAQKSDLTAFRKVGKSRDSLLKVSERLRVSEESLSWKYLYKVNSTVQIKG